MEHTTTPAGQDPVKLAPDIYKVLLENERVRVLDIRMKPGDHSPMHSHPNYLAYVLTDGKVRFTAPDGTSEEVEFKASQPTWREAESHEVENIGSSELHLLNIELK
jgi:beta-alanine degradation protein BauB